MELIVQSSFLPIVEPIFWLHMDVQSWAWQSADNVNRETENAALRSIQRQSKLFSRSRMISLTPLHRRVHKLELYYMVRHPHYNALDVERAIAEHMGIGVTKVKRVLLDTSVIYSLFISAGYEELLNN